MVSWISSTPPYNADFDGDEMNMQYVSPSPHIDLYPLFKTLFQYTAK